MTINFKESMHTEHGTTAPRTTRMAGMIMMLQPTRMMWTIMTS
jgi:hypothetical protein